MIHKSCQILPVTRLRLITWDFCTTCYFQNHLLTFPTHSIFTFQQHAYALEHLKDQLIEGNRALDVGSGSGYLTVCFSKMVGNKGSVLGIDHMKEVSKSDLNVSLPFAFTVYISIREMDDLAGISRLSSNPVYFTPPRTARISGLKSQVLKWPFLA